MNGIIHVIGQNYREYWIDGQGVTMMEKSGFNAVRNGQTLTIYRENGVATEIDGAILVEILEATPKTVEIMTNEEEDEQPPADYRNDKLNGKLFDEMHRIESIEREEYKRKFPHGCCNRSGNAVRFLNVVKDHDIETVGKLLEAGSKSVSRMLNIGKKTLEEVSMALENVYGITEW
jgi:DNA-directed RNA polymerase alpha subunit